MNRCTCVPARQRQHLHVPYQICYHFLKNTKKYRRGDTRHNPPEIPGGNTPPAVRRSRLVKNCDLSSLMMGTWFVLSFCQGQNNVYVIKTPSYDLSTELLYPSHDMAMFLWAPKIHVCLVRTYTSLDSNTSQQEAVWIWPTQNFWLLVSSVH